MELDCASRTHVGLRRKLNEDAVLARPAQRLFAVADGMGGHDAGEVASRQVVEALASLPDLRSVEASLAAIVEALQATHRELRIMAAGGPETRTIGTTVVGLTVQEQRFGCFWSGDSRAYRLRAGSLARLTRDHSLVQELVDAGMLSERDAPHHPSANIITRAVGADEKLEVEAITGDVRRGDRFLLASDGLTRHVGDAELELALASGSPDECADHLLELVLARGAYDNVSMVVVDA